MLTIDGNIDNKINYTCSCGMTGFCILKPMENMGIIIADICCPECRNTNRLFMLQYFEDSDIDTILEDTGNLECDWMIA